MRSFVMDPNIINYLMRGFVPLTFVIRERRKEKQNPWKSCKNV